MTTRYTTEGGIVAGLEVERLGEQTVSLAGVRLEDWHLYPYRPQAIALEGTLPDGRLLVIHITTGADGALEIHHATEGGAPVPEAPTDRVELLEAALTFRRGA